MSGPTHLLLRAACLACLAAACAGSATPTAALLDALFERRIASPLLRTAHHHHRRRTSPTDLRSADALGATFDGCPASRAACMLALTLTPSTRTPDPQGLADEAAKCARESCSCAGPPAAYDEVEQTCKSDTGELLQYHYTESLGGNATKSWYPGASCGQVERCFSAECDITAWKTYTAGLEACDTMWHCMRRTLEMQKCAESVTVDRGNETCSQAAICAAVEAERGAMPVVAVDCSWEYSRVLNDQVMRQQIDATCGERACRCLRRGIPGFCNGASTCCINGQAWDKKTQTPASSAFDLLDCGEVSDCVPDGTYCKLVAEPEKLMPAACAGYPAAQYTAGKERCGSGYLLSAAGKQCFDMPLNECSLVQRATVAKCGSAPFLTYQKCAEDTTPDATGKCICNESPNQATECAASGVCARTPLCDLSTSCGEHGLSVKTTLAGCECTCGDGWTGTRCDVPLDDDALPPLTIVALCVGGVALALAVAAVIFCWCSRQGTAPQRDIEEQLLAKMKATEEVLPPEGGGSTGPSPDTHPAAGPATLQGSEIGDTQPAICDKPSQPTTMPPGGNPPPASLVSVPTTITTGVPASPLPPLAQAPQHAHHSAAPMQTMLPPPRREAGAHDATHLQQQQQQQTRPAAAAASGGAAPPGSEAAEGQHQHQHYQHHQQQHHAVPAPLAPARGSDAGVAGGGIGFRRASVGPSSQATTDDCSSVVGAAPCLTRGMSGAKEGRGRRASFVAAPASNRSARSRRGSSRSEPAMAAALTLAEAELEHTREGHARHASRGRSSSRHSEAGRREKSANRSRSRTPSGRKSRRASLRGDPEVEEALRMLNRQLDHESVARGSLGAGGGGVMHSGVHRRGGGGNGQVSVMTADTAPAFSEEDLRRQFNPLSPPMAQRDPSTSLTARQAEILARHL